jgi:hypothetical protein
MATKNTSNVLIWILAIVAVLLCTYLLFTKQIMAAYYKLKAPKINASDTDAPITPNNGNAGNTPSPKYLPNVEGGNNEPLKANYQTANYKKMLRKGSKGNEVLILQIKMNDYLVNKIVADGNFGPATEKALKSLTGYITISLQGAIDFIKNKLAGNYLGDENNYTGGRNNIANHRNNFVSDKVRMCNCKNRY